MAGSGSITAVMLAKGLALGYLSWSAAADFMYVPQGGTLEVPRGEDGIDAAVVEFRTVLMAVMEIEPEALEGLRTDAELQAEYGESVRQYPAALLTLADYYARTHAARVRLLLSRLLAEVELTQ